ncbi:hypothetical protein [Alishewanella tabrizica]|nr:hypothetical protein [Alishewanella tabrizica]
MLRTFATMMIIVGSLVLVSPAVLSHTDVKPQYGGVVYTKYDLSFELVREKEGVSLYVGDHGEPFATESLTGQVVILAAGKKSEVMLRSIGAGKMHVPELQIPDGAKVVITLTDKNKKMMTIRYSF